MCFIACTLWPPYSCPACASSFFAVRNDLLRTDPLSAAHPLFCPQRSQHKPAHVEEVRNHSCENETPEPLIGPVCFRGGSGWEFHGQRGAGGRRWYENSAKYCLVKARD